MDILTTEKAILELKNIFQKNLSKNLNLYRVSAPLFVEKTSGVQDNLNGIEKPVSFSIKYAKGKYEIVHSLAKWKRQALADYNIPIGSGIWTDMNAIRTDENILESNIHSVYVDQWDWEKNIALEDRNLSYMKDTVENIYKAILTTERKICKKYSLSPFLTKRGTFIHTEQLVKEYPDLNKRERENIIAEKYGTVFLIGIGGALSDGKIHDGRAPDYDDWSTKNEDGYYGLNGDIIVWNPILKSAFEISSMGIRVDQSALLKQLEICDCSERLKFPWHKKLMNDELPYSIGGGIGQSRLSMLLLQKKHIGEVQSSVWPKNVLEYCKKNNIKLL